jgi:hypothetical protein
MQFQDPPLIKNRRDKYAAAGDALESGPASGR